MLMLTDQEFDAKVLQSDKPVFVYCSAEWCGPCKALGPIVEKVSLEEELKDKVDFYKVDVDASQNISTTYNIRAVPTMLLFNKGNVIQTLVGLNSKAKIIETIKKELCQEEPQSSS